MNPFDIDSNVLIVGLGLLGGSYAMWSELFMLNKEPLLQQMEVFMDEFGELKRLIAEEDVPALREKMKLSTQRRALFDRK